MLGDLSEQEMNSLLENQLVGRIGCHTDGEIFVVPITYVYKDGYIYGHSREGKKIHMMRKNPRVCFEVDEMESISHWKSVMIWGEYEEMESEKDKADAFKILSDRLNNMEASETMMKPSYDLPNPHPHNAGAKPIAYRIKALEKSGRYEQKY